MTQPTPLVTCQQHAGQHWMEDDCVTPYTSSQPTEHFEVRVASLLVRTSAAQKRLAENFARMAERLVELAEAQAELHKATEELTALLKSTPATAEVKP